jgi:acyl-CoA thioester hydrolase
VSAFVHRLRVRYHECDAQGIVFNAHHFAFADIALTELWREAFGSYGAMVERGVDVVVAEAGARFLAPARFDDELDVALRIEQLGNTSMTTAIETRRTDGALLVEGSIRHVCVDPRTLAKQPFPEDVRATLERYR